MQIPRADTSPIRPLVIFFTILLFFFLFSGIAFAAGADTYFTIIASQLIVILGGAILYEKKFAPKRTPWISFKKLGMPWWMIPLVALSAVALGFLGNLLAAATVELIPALQEMADRYQENVERLLLSEGLRPQILGAISVAIVAPLCEEYLFRRTLLTEQLRHQGFTLAILLNGLLFSAMHVNPVAFLSLFLIGAFLAHLTLRTGAIWAAIIAHAALNTVNGVILPRVAQTFAAPDELSFSEIGLGLLLIAPITIGLWWLTIYLLRRFSDAEPPPSRPAPPTL